MGYGYECRCHEGYTGSRCEKKIQPELGNQTLRWVIQVSLQVLENSLGILIPEDVSRLASKEVVAVEDSGEMELRLLKIHLELNLQSLLSACSDQLL
ncbi:hypothetical protein CEXT_491721 [Caerostris extrusa]|uniref:EGF-like domain-containing protein n=1 Tax=Caerostris extrusa TaxID=172846 RepID=A0AAV4PYW2_CAEEX|nr:hypothetical protein CEXT_491721 [Caerostris extrusa]